MKKPLAVLVLLFSALAFASPDPKPADYQLNVRVISSRARGTDVRLTVTIDGKKYELSGGGYLLNPGDYKAKVIRERHQNNYETYRIYEFLLPENKTRTFVVTGLLE